MLNIPILSIIVPSYNMEKYLPKCLGSLVVAPELMDRLEVLVVNDGSKDRTSEIAHDFASKWPQTFKVIDKPNGNYGSCINAALPKCEGVFVKVLDADDTFETAAFSIYLKRLDGMSHDTDLVLTDYVQVDESGAVVARFECPFAEEDIIAVDHLLDQGYNVSMHAVTLRTELLREIGYRQTEGISYTDSEWVYLPVAACRCIRCVKVSLYHYLIGRAGQTMEQSTWVRNRSALEKIMDRMFSIYDESARNNRINVRYLEFKIKLMIETLTNIKVYYAPVHEAQMFFSALRDLRARYEFVPDGLDRFDIFSRTPLRWRYAFTMMRMPCSSWLVLPIVRLYSCLIHRLSQCNANESRRA